MFKGLKSLAGIFGFKDDNTSKGSSKPNSSSSADAPRPDRPDRPRSGRSRAVDVQPVLQDAGYSGLGGIQGLTWYTRSLRIDEAGDVAHSFYLEGAPRPAAATVPFPDGFQVGVIDGGNVVLVS